MYYALIVLYNKSLNDCKTYDIIKKYKKDIIPIIFDNSSEKFVKINKQYCLNNKIQYCTLNKNVGLSKAYNYIINEIKSKSKADYIMIFDDDTELNDRYIKEALSLMKKNEYDIILPIIKANNHILSPTKLIFNIKYVEIKNPKSINHKKIDAINTGMIVKINVYENIKYDDRLFLDDIDHLFIYQAKRKKFKFYIMDSVIYQNYSRFQENSIESEKFRFKIWMKDHKTYCKIRKIRLFYIITSIKHRIREYIKNNYNTYFLFYKNK